MWDLSEELQTAFVKLVLEKVKKEVDTVSKENAKVSLFKIQKDDSMVLRESSFISNMLDETKEKLPTVYAFAKAIAFNKVGVEEASIYLKKKIKTEESLNFPILQSISLLLKCYNQRCNALAQLNAVILRRGGLEKSAFVRMFACGFCVSYPKALQIQTALGKDHDAKALSWKSSHESKTQETNQLPQQLEPPKTSSPIHHAVSDKPPHSPFASQSSVAELEISASAAIQTEDINDFTLTQEIADMELLDEPVKTLNDNSPVNYVLVNDNVNIRIQARQTTMHSGNQQLNYFNSMVTKCRVPLKEEVQPEKLVVNKPFTNEQQHSFFPTTTEDESVRQDMVNTICQILHEHLPELNFTNNPADANLTHGLSEFTKQKSENVPLGVIFHDENQSAELAEILEWTQQYIPKEKCIINFGDELTVERILNLIEAMASDCDISKQHKNIIPSLSDFHTFGNFLDAIWQGFYDPSSAGDMGTMYQSKLYLGATNVPLKPMKNVDSSYDFIKQYTEVLVITMFQQESHAKSSEESPEETARRMVDAILPVITPEKIGGAKGYRCTCCPRMYATLTALNLHKDTHLTKKRRGNLWLVLHKIFS